MEQKMFMSESFATGSEIFEVIQKLEPALDGVPRAHVVIAALSIALTVMHPNLSPEEIQAGVREVSQFICLWLSTTDTVKGEMPTIEVMN